MATSDAREPMLLTSLWRAVVSLVSAAFLLTAVALLGLLNRPAAQALYRFWARLQCRIFRISVEVDQRGDFPTPCVLVQLNQASFVESIVYTQSMPASRFRLFVNV